MRKLTKGADQIALGISCHLKVRQEYSDHFKSTSAQSS